MPKQNGYIYIYPVESLSDSHILRIFDYIKHDALIVTFYPESCRNFVRDSRSKKADILIEPITEYLDGKNQCRFLIEDGELNNILSQYEEYIDNIGIYDGKNWKLCFIPHEKIIIAKRDLEKIFKKNHIDFSIEAPEWW